MSKKGIYTYLFVREILQKLEVLEIVAEKPHAEPLPISTAGKHTFYKTPIIYLTQLGYTSIYLTVLQ